MLSTSPSTMGVQGILFSSEKGHTLTTMSNKSNSYHRHPKGCNTG